MPVSDNKDQGKVKQRHSKPIGEFYTDYNPHIPPVPKAQDLVAEARKFNQFIFDPSDKAWYTPDEFSGSFGKYLHGYDAIMKRVVLMDPKEGIKAGYKKLEELKAKLEDLTLKTITYYQDKK